MIITSAPPLIEELSRADLDRYGEFDDHARVIRFSERRVGLRGFIAIHRTRGPLSTGGTRYFNYTKEEDALRDALRLSAAMTAKCVVSGLPYGGAKGVILCDLNNNKSEDFLNAYAQVVNALGGAFRTGEDVGMTEGDVQILLRTSRFFNGKSDIAGDPSPYAAKSVHVVLRTIAKEHLGRQDLRGASVVVRGVGKVGGALVELLHHDGCVLSVSDIDAERCRLVVDRHPDIQIAENSGAPFRAVDVYAPCAMGAEVTRENWQKFRAKIICGGANNQLVRPEMARFLESRGTLFVPDFLANAGGLINVSEELEKDGYHPERVRARINALGALAQNMYRESLRLSSPLSAVLDEYVRIHT